jgi:pimeloyl-ACP methyl ester carboxylesterase
VRTAVEPAPVHVDEAVLIDLRRRLAETRLPHQPDDEDWSLGTDAGYLRELCDYWRDAFDWRAVEARINGYGPMRTRFDGSEDSEGLDVHFLHVRSREPGAFPLLVTHGWPGSIVEFLDWIPRLTDPVAHGGSAEDAFDVVCPSLPGFGLSAIPTRPGTGPHRIAQMWASLMERLGYDRYGAQGGDYGSVISTVLGAVDPAHCAAVHLNMVLAGPPREGDPLAGLSDREHAHLEETQRNARSETGYYAIQSTRPGTLGFALQDSPAGLAAWIIEKFRRWSDCGGDLEKAFDKDQLLANVTLYWVTGTITSSCRLYQEMARGERVVPGPVPTGAALLPGELIRAPRAWAERRYPGLVHWSELPRGGHFAAMEVPDLLAEDVRRFFRPYRARAGA